MKFDLKQSTGSLEFEFSQLDAVASAFGSLLKTQCLRCVGLKGDLGAGKTTFVGALLRSWGYDPTLPVPSPTFTCVQEYQLDIGWVAHCDFYRIDDPVSEMDVLLDHRDFSFVLAEWPKNLKQSGELDMLLELSPTGETSRRITWSVLAGDLT